MIRIPAISFQNVIVSQLHDSPLPPVDKEMIHDIVSNAPAGELSATDSLRLMEAIGIGGDREIVASTIMQAKMAAIEIGYPVNIQSICEDGTGECIEDITDENTMRLEYKRLMLSSACKGVRVSPSMGSSFIYFGIRQRPMLGHILLCGIYSPSQRHPDTFVALTAPVDRETAADAVKQFSGESPVQMFMIADTLRRLGALCEEAPRISSADIMPTVTGTRSIVATGASFILK